jgi:DNA-binding MarR family transcriptional regulator
MFPLGDDNVRRKLAWKMDKTYMVRRGAMSKLAADAGLYAGQLPIIAYVNHHPGCTQKELADWLGVSAASVALSTKRLQKQGLIDKSVDETNLRRNMLSVTEKGREVAFNHRRNAGVFDDRMLEGVTDEELETLSRVMDKMLANMQGGSTAAPDYRPMQEMDARIRQREEKK